MNILINLIIVYVNTARKQDINYEIALFILKNYYRIENVNIKEIIEKCYTSRNTVLKFCELFGYSSWVLFRDRLVQTKQIKEEQIKQRLASINKDEYYLKLAHVTGSIDHPQYIQEIKNNILKIVDDIYESDRVFLFGAVTPLSLAIEFQADMICVSKLVYENYEDSIEPLNNRDMAIILSATGRFIREKSHEFYKVYNSNAKKGIVTLSNQFQNMSNFRYYFHLFQSSDVYDFHWFIVMLLDLIFMEYYDKYAGKDN